MTSDATPTQVPDGTPAPPTGRARRKAAFKQRDIERAIKGAKAAGVQDP